MNFLRDLFRGLALLLALFIVLSLPPALLGYNLGQKLFKPEALLALSVEHGLREPVLAAAWETAVADLSSDAIFSPQTWLGQWLRAAGQNAELREQIAPRALLVETARQGIANGFAWLDSPNPEPAIRVDLRPFKQHVADGSNAIVNDALTRLAPCTVEQAAELGFALLNDLLSGGNTAVAIPLCLPPDLILPGFISATRLALVEQLRFIPDDLLVQIRAGAGAADLARTQALLRLARFGMAWSWFGLAALLLATAVLGGQSIRGFLQWLGWLLLLIATLALLLALAWLALGRGLAWLLLPDLPAWLAIIVNGTVDGLVGETGQALLWQAAVPALLGVGALGTAFLFGGRGTR